MSPTPWLVTGAGGFLGRALLDALAARGIPAIAAGRRPVPGVAFVPMDLGDFDGLAAAVRHARPAVVIHLAGALPPAPSGVLYDVNVGGTHRLVRALEAPGRPVRLVVAGSAAELGPVPVERLPADEATPCRPDTAYGLSKWFASRLALGARGPVEPVVARVFNPIGPGLPRAQAFGRFAALLAEAPGDPLAMAVGDLDARRDVVDVRDVAAALVALADRGRPREVYHVGSGRSVRIGDGLDELIARSGRRVEVAVAPGVARGPRDSRADIRKITADTGWTPAIDWRRSLADLLDTARAAALRDGRLVA
jgi:GDP-4-dehydro-6-deoxy-D-mannose reductase